MTQGITPRQADKAIRSKLPVKIRDLMYNDTHTVLITGRDRWHITIQTAGGVSNELDRSNFEIIGER